MCGHGDVGPRRRRPSTLRCNVDDDRDFGVVYGLDDFTGGGIQAARGVDLKHQDSGALLLSLPNAAHNVGGGWRIDYAVERENEDVGLVLR